jgi:ABC-2 type transport system ATP-binding protein
MMLADEVIVASNLSRRFGSFVAVRDVSFSVKRGEIFGVLGPNGAGKSTTIRMLCGILDPTGGSATVVGYDVKREPDRVKERIGYMTQRFSLYEDLSVEENLGFFADLYGVPWRKRRSRVDATIERTGLGDRRKQIAGTLSGGWKQRVALASATIHEPPLLFLDEPTAGVDPVSRREFWEQIHVIAHEGTTVLVTTHYMDEAERCHRLAFIFQGRVMALGTPSRIVDERHLIAFEFENDKALEVAQELRKEPGVDQVSHLGSVLRVIAQQDVNPRALLDRVLSPLGLDAQSYRMARPSVEDAFIHMVHTQNASAGAA